LFSKISEKLSAPHVEGRFWPIDGSVKTAVRIPQNRPWRPRSRFGYGPQWWGARHERVQDTCTSYWARTRRPIPSLAFVLPILIVYEAGVIWVGGASTAAARTGADAWLRTAIGSLGLTDRWLVPLGLVFGLLAWQVIEPRQWRCSPSTLLGMAVESVVLAIALIGLSKLVDLGFDHLEGRPVLAASAAPARHPAAAIVGYLGAGVYEETIFRLALIPLLFGLLRLLQAPQVLARTLAVTASALLFSIAHHAGAPGESFTWFAFIFRWLAGVFFAWVFVARGFGIAVGTHAAYDILVGWIGWHF
jgi:hypothetical protein